MKPKKDKKDKETENFLRLIENFSPEDQMKDRGLLIQGRVKEVYRKEIERLRREQNNG